MDKQVYYDSAREMLIQEHTRWTSWSLLFLGIIGATFVGIEHLKEVIPLWFIFVFDAIVSFSWLCVILNIRATTHAWSQTLIAIEKDDNIKPFRYHDDVRNDFSIWRDIGSNLCVVPQNGKDNREFKIFSSVTRVLTLLSFIMVIIFVGIAIRYNKQPETTSLTMLGKKLIERDLSSIYEGAKIIEVLEPLKNNKNETIIQVRVVLQSSEQVFVNWRLEQSGAILFEQSRNMPLDTQ